MPKLTILTQICLVRDTLWWKLKGGDLELVIILFIKIYMGCILKLADKDLYPNIHTILKCSIVLPVTSVFCERTFSALRRLKTWVRSTMMGERLCGLAMLSQKHGCESGKHFKTMMPLATVKLEDFLWTTKTCSNLNSSYNYINNICFELSILTFIPALYTKTLTSI